jgi:hypothetical protein
VERRQATGLTGRRAGAVSLARSFLVRLGFELHRPSGPGSYCELPVPAASRPVHELVCGINHAFLAGFLEGLGVIGRRRARFSQARVLRGVASRSLQPVTGQPSRPSNGLP